MGLDMYLYAEKYISRKDYKSGNLDDDTPGFSAIVSITDSSDIVDPDGWSGISINIPVAYWRKANAIHGYFVEVWGEGVDNCQPIHVPRSGLQDLLNMCKEIIKSKGNEEFDANSILPPVAGFFFGSYEIDDWYFEDIQNTIDMLERILANKEENYFIYQASW